MVGSEHDHLLQLAHGRLDALPRFGVDAVAAPVVDMGAQESDRAGARCRDATPRGWVRLAVGVERLVELDRAPGIHLVGHCGGPKGRQVVLLQGLGTRLVVGRAFQHQGRIELSGHLLRNHPPDVEGPELGKIDVWLAAILQWSQRHTALPGKGIAPDTWTWTPAYPSSSTLLTSSPAARTSAPARSSCRSMATRESLSPQPRFMASVIS